MSHEMMNTKELAAYLNLNEKKVYALIQQGEIPCTKVTGKWIFPRSLIDDWIHSSAQRKQASVTTHDILIMGSHDLLMDVLAREVNRRFPQIAMLCANVGSLGGLAALQQGRSHMAGAHLLDPQTNEYNLPYLPQYVPELETVVVHFVNREQGLVVQPGNPKEVHGFEDLCRPEVRFINRQEGAGTRLLLDHHLQQLGMKSEQIPGYLDQVSTHTEVAMRVRHGFADTGLSIRSAALAFGLDFVPVTTERFDFIIPKAHFYTEAIQELLDVMRSRDFLQKAEQIGGYDVRDVGTVVAWS